MQEMVITNGLKSVGKPKDMESRSSGKDLPLVGKVAQCQKRGWVHR